MGSAGSAACGPKGRQTACTFSPAATCALACRSGPQQLCRPPPPPALPPLRIRRRGLGSRQGLCASAAAAVAAAAAAAAAGDSQPDRQQREQQPPPPPQQQDVQREILGLALPTLATLAADPIASLVSTAFIGRLGAAPLAAAGVALSIFGSVTKLLNVPLLVRARWAGGAAGMGAARVREGGWLPVDAAQPCCSCRPVHRPASSAAPQAITTSSVAQAVGSEQQGERWDRRQLALRSIDSLLHAAALLAPPLRGAPPAVVGCCTRLLKRSPPPSLQRALRGSGTTRRCQLPSPPPSCWRRWRAWRRRCC